MDDDYGDGAALMITNPANLAAAVQYLQAIDLGDAGITLAFDYGADTFVYTQGDDAGTNSLDILVQLVGVQVTALVTLSTSVSGSLYIA